MKGDKSAQKPVNVAIELNKTFNRAVGNGGLKYSYHGSLFTVSNRTDRTGAVATNTRDIGLHVLGIIRQSSVVFIHGLLSSC